MRITSVRKTSQLMFFLVSLLGFFGVGMSGIIYPYFFCWASPGACAACPLGVMEHASIQLGSGAFLSSLTLWFYLLGFLGALGAIVGRAFCGWACPVGYLQHVYTRWRRVSWSKTSYLLIVSIVGAALLATVIGAGLYSIPLPGLLAALLGFASIVLLDLGLVGLLWKLDRLYVDLGFVIVGVLVVDVGLSFRGWEFIVLIGAIALIAGVMGLTRRAVGARRTQINYAMIAAGAILAFLFLVLPHSTGLFILGLFLLFGGLASEVMRALSLSFGDLAHRFRRTDQSGRARRLQLKHIKYFVLAFIPISSLITGTMLFTDLDPIGAVTATIPTVAMDPLGWSANEFFVIKIVLTALFFVAITFVGLFWCRFLCPLGALFAGMNKFSIISMRTLEQQCINCGKCNRACPTKIDVINEDRDPECIRCGKCVDVCPTAARRFTLLGHPLGPKKGGK